MDAETQFARVLSDSPDNGGDNDMISEKLVMYVLIWFGFGGYVFRPASYASCDRGNGRSTTSRRYDIT